MAGTMRCASARSYVRARSHIGARSDAGVRGHIGVRSHIRARSDAGARSHIGARPRPGRPCRPTRRHARDGREADRPARSRGPACALVRAQTRIPVRTVILAGTRILGRIVRPGAHSRVARPGPRSQISRPGVRGRAVTDHRPAGARIPAGPRIPVWPAGIAGYWATSDCATGDGAIADRAIRARRCGPRSRGVTNRRGRPRWRGRPARRRVTSVASRSGQARIPPGSRGRVLGPADASDRRAARLPGLPRCPSRVRRPAHVRRPARVGHARTLPCRRPARGARRTPPTALPRLSALLGTLAPRWPGRGALRRPLLRSLALPDQPTPRLTAPGSRCRDGIRGVGVRRDRPYHRGRDRQRRPPGHRQPGDGLVLLGAGDLGLGGLGRGGNADPPPDPADHDDLVFFGQWCHTAPGGRFPQVTRLGNEQLGQAFTFQYRPRRQPREEARRQHVQPEQTVVERQAEQREKNYIGHRNGGEYCNLPYGQRHWQAEIVELVQPFLNPPDARIGGQLHRSLSLCPDGDQWTPRALAIPCASVCTMLGV
jgi:hypothetical protein